MIAQSNTARSKWQGLFGYMLCGYFCLLFVDVAAAQINKLTEAERRSGWQLAFDGKTTEGWRSYRQPALSKGWEVVDGAITRVGRAGDIITKKKYRYFELSLEYKISRGGNSGVMFHVTENNPAPWHSGPEIQIQDNKDGHDPQKAGWLYQLYRPVKPGWAKRFEAQVGFKSKDNGDATKPAGQWNQLYVRIAAQQCEVAMNGVSYYKFKLGSDDWKQRVAQSKFARFANFGMAGEGHLCLQDHGNRVAYRSIKIRELDADGAVPNPIDGELPLVKELAFPNLTWEGFDGADESGKVRPLRPMEITHAGDDSGRIFVASQIGMIHVFDKKQDKQEARLFLDIRDRVHDWRKDNEEGLLGLAFHPDYKKNGFFYVYYSSKAEPRNSIVARYQVSSKDSDRADADSEFVVTKIKQPFSNHNGGSIAFGGDGYLYIGLGDGGGRNDPMEHGQNLGTLMGSILRIDVNKKSGDKNYSVPADNPFVDRKGACPEIYAFGLRNVWRLAFDQETDELWAADVGQDLWEEINLIESGGNYGWSVREGSYGFSNRTSPPPTPPIGPVWEYDHRIGRSITGGEVYRGERLPELQGAYVYADYVTGRVWALWYDSKSRKVVRNMAIDEPGTPVLCFGHDADNELYFAVGAASGQTIYRFKKK